MRAGHALKPVQTSSHCTCKRKDANTLEMEQRKPTCSQHQTAALVEVRGKLVMAFRLAAHSCCTKQGMASHHSPLHSPPTICRPSSTALSTHSACSLVNPLPAGHVEVQRTCTSVPARSWQQDPARFGSITLVLAKLLQELFMQFPTLGHEGFEGFHSQLEARIDPCDCLLWRCPAAH